MIVVMLVRLTLICCSRDEKEDDHRRGSSCVFLDVKIHIQTLVLDMKDVRFLCFTKLNCVRNRERGLNKIFRLCVLIWTYGFSVSDWRDLSLLYVE